MLQCIFFISINAFLCVFFCEEHRTKIFECCIYAREPDIAKFSISKNETESFSCKEKQKFRKNVKTKLHKQIQKSNFVQIFKFSSLHSSLGCPDPVFIRVWPVFRPFTRAPVRKQFSPRGQSRRKIKFSDKLSEVSDNCRKFPTNCRKFPTNCPTVENLPSFLLS